MQQRTFSVRAGRLAALEVVPARGERGTVLLVPGFTGSKEDFAPLLPAVAERGWRAVAIDQRGQYESPGPDDPEAYTVASLAADLLSLLDALPGPVHLVGHSFGGLVSRRAVLLRPTAFATLALMGSGPAGLTGPRTDPLPYLRPLVAQGGLAAVAEASDALSASDTTRPPQTPELRAFLRTRFLASSPTGLLAMADALLGEPDHVADLRAAGLPVLVLHGEHDDAWSPALQEDMAARLGAAYVVVPGALHSPAVENPGPTAEALLAFWESALAPDATAPLPAPS